MITQKLTVLRYGSFIYPNSKINFMIVTKRLTLFLTCLLFCLASFAQDKTITGNVSTFDDNTALAGVSVTIKGTGQATLTDSTGNFTIQAASGQTLQFSYIGYVNKEVVVGKVESAFRFAQRQWIQQITGCSGSRLWHTEKRKPDGCGIPQ